ncbi:unnamed protein product [Arctia plantaginis]|uniref:Uncharacterized protein n=1 Tax=Arctia plantaginis TaxID=874455 RepID=A0A8S0ZYC2_ARCPL|nr:unnamed protein product [Arctia plantaginis]
MKNYQNVFRTVKNIVPEFFTTTSDIMAITAAEKRKRENIYYQKLKKKVPVKYDVEKTIQLLRLAKNVVLYLVLSDKLAKMRAAVDTRAPAARPHVALKLKKASQEQDRTNRVQRDNYTILQRLERIMKVNRLDNRWSKPLPNFQQKVGLFYDVESLSSKVAARSHLADESEESYHNVKCYACEIKKKQYNFAVTKPKPPQDFLPSIYSN